MMVLLNSRVAKNEKMPWRIIEGEAILVDVDNGEIIHLNPVGAKIWDSIDGKRPVKEIIGHICGQFEVDNKTAQKDTLEFLDKLVKNGAVKCLKNP